MVQVSRRTGTAGSALIRLLTRLAEIDVRETPQTFADRLSDWLRWTDAMSLFTALQDGPANVPMAVPMDVSVARQPPRARASPPRPAAGVGVEAATCERLRSTLLAANADDSAFTPEKSRARLHAPTTGPALEMPVEFAPYRRHYQDRQQAMETSIAPLRAYLRGALAARSQALGRLAEVDVVMERVLGEHERRLLSAVPGVLHKRFERVRDAARDTSDTSDIGASIDASAARHAPWLQDFRQDLHDVLSAELELRWQPIEGLLAALQTQAST